MRTYTFAHCTRLMDVDPKVFRRWVKEDLGLQPCDQVSRADKRVRYLTHEQVEHLADLHDRTLADDATSVKQESSSFASYKLLEDRLAVAEEALHAGQRTASSAQECLTQVQERLKQVEQQVSVITRWAALLEGLPTWMAQLETRMEHLAPQEEQHDPRLTELEAQHHQQVAELEARYRRQIAELEAQLAQYHTDERSPSIPPAMTKKKTPSHPKPLPRALASRSSFAALHHIPDSIVARACNAGKIATVNGRWLYKSRVIFQALGVRGQHDFYQIFHTRADFSQCSQCPHAITQA